MIKQESLEAVIPALRSSHSQKTRRQLNALCRAGFDTAQESSEDEADTTVRDMGKGKAAGIATPQPTEGARKTQSGNGKGKDRAVQARFTPPYQRFEDRDQDEDEDEDEDDCELVENTVDC